MTRTPNRRMRQILQRWKLVLAIVVLTTLAAAGYTMVQHTTYVGKSSLIISGRAPEQDAITAVGYVSIFNDPATIRRLVADEDLPKNVRFAAQTAAASPIVIIQATAEDPTVAQNAAENMARVFGNDINMAQQGDRQKYIEALERRLSEHSPITPNGSPDVYWASLQERIDTLNSQDVNQLYELQPRAGIDANTPKLKLNVIFGLVGGLLLGCLTALFLAAVSRRVTSSADLEDKVGIEPLVEIPADGSASSNMAGEVRLRTLANILNLQDVPHPRVTALTDCRGVQAARGIAESLALLSAQQGYRTVLVHADNNSAGSASGAGFNDALAENGVATQALRDGEVAGLKILAAGAISTERYPWITRERIGAVLDELRVIADSIIVAAPPISDTAEAQLLCAAADATVLFVRKGKSRIADLDSAARTLAEVRANTIGAVLVNGVHGYSAGGRADRSPRDSAARDATERTAAGRHAHQQDSDATSRAASRPASKELLVDSRVQTSRAGD